MKKLTLFVLLGLAALSALTAQDVEVFPQLGMLSRSSWQKNMIIFSPNSKWLITNGRTNNQIFDANTGRELRTNSGYVLAQSPDGKSCLRVSGSYIVLFDPLSGVNIKTFKHGASNVRCGGYSPDGRRIVSCSEDGTIKIWDIASGTETRSISMEGDQTPSEIAYSPDGRRIMSAFYNSTIKIWDAETGRELLDLAGKGEAKPFGDKAIYSPDGKSIIYITRHNDQSSVVIVNAETGKEIRKITDNDINREYLTCSPDGKNIVTTGRIPFTDNNYVKIWDVDTGRELKKIEELKGIWAPAYSADGKRFVFGINDSGYRGFIKILDAKTYRELLTISPTPQVYSAISPNNKWVAVVMQKTVKIWDISTGAVIRTTSRGTVDAWSGSDSDSGYCWSPDGKKFAFTHDNGGKDNKIMILDIETNRQTPIDKQDFIGVDDLSYSPDGRRILLETEYSINVFDTTNGNRLFSINKAVREQDGTLRGRPPLISFHSVSWHPDGGQMVINYSYNDENTDTSRIFDTQTGREIRTLGTDLYNPVYSPDGKRIAARSSDTVKLWDAASGREIRTAIKHEKLSVFAYTPDGKMLITGSDNNFVAAWNAENGTRLWEKNQYSGIAALSVSPDSKIILAVIGNAIGDGGKTINVIDAATGNTLAELTGFRNDISSASFSADGQWIAAASKDGTVRIWSAETFTEKAQFISYDDGEWLAMTPDGYYNASANGEKYINARVGNTVSGIDRYRRTFNKPDIVAARLSNPARMTHGDAIVSVSVNPAGTRIASVSLDKSIKLWDLESGKLLRTISNIGGSVNALSFSPDGKRLIHGAEDKTIRIWDAETGAAVRTITGHTDYVNEARYSPDGRRIASCADDKLVRIWDAGTGREIRTLTGHTDMVPVVAWSPNGRRIASGSDKTEKAIRIWDAENGRLLQTLTGQGGRVNALAFSPDGKRIASSTLEDRAIKIWDAETGRQIRSIPVEGHGGVYSLAWSPDGKRLASGAVYGGEDDYGAHIEIWNAETGENISTIWEGGSIFSLTWTPDGRRLVAGSTYSDLQTIKVYDVLTGKEL